MSKLDLSSYSTAAGAAKALARHFKERFDASEPELQVLRPEKAERLGYGSTWAVMWEGGLWNWPVMVGSGENIACGSFPELRKNSKTAEPKIVGVYDGGFRVEAYNQFVLSFYND